MSKLPVYFETRTVGEIDVTEAGPGFSYDPAWMALREKGAFPVSTCMPFSADRVPAKTFLPWASNLLPESDALRAVGLSLGKSTGDVVGILSEIGRDTAGALSIGRPGSSVIAGNWRRIDRPADLTRILDELPSKPFLVGEDGISMSLAGVQSKLAVGFDGKDLFIPMDGSPSSHILKPDSSRLPGGVQNEAFCLSLARRIGIKVPSVSTGKAGVRSYMLIERYDRTNAAGKLRRLHQEDFCQALGKPPAAKYQSNDTGIAGPTLADMFGVVRQHMIPADTLRMLDMVVFNVLAGNTDAHAKNYSIVINAREPSLAPMYDVLCGGAWEHITKKLAQKVGGENRGDYIKKRHWERFASECGLNPRQVVERVGMLAKKTAAEVENAMADVEAMPAGGHPILDDVRRAVGRRSIAVLRGLADPVPAAKADDEASIPAGPR